MSNNQVKAVEKLLQLTNQDKVKNWRCVGREYQVWGNILNSPTTPKWKIWPSQIQFKGIRLEDISYELNKEMYEAIGKSLKRQKETERQAALKSLTGWRSLFS